MQVIKLKTVMAKLLCFCLLVLISKCTSNICADVCHFTLRIKETRSMMWRDTSQSSPTGVMNAYKVNVTEDGSLKPVGFTDMSGFHVSNIPNVTIPVDQVHSVDGYTRTIITINDQFPGPTLEVMEGAQVVVTVVNELLKEGVTIHWHGFHHRNNPWMDGLPFVTQCPILPKQSFQYRFIAWPPGTRWYHSHLELQRSDGLYGAFIIHRSTPKVPYFTALLSDWFQYTSTELELSNPFALPGREGDGKGWMPYVLRGALFYGPAPDLPAIFWSGIINGKGRHGNKAPLTEYTVKPGQKFQMHVINAGYAWDFRFSIDMHNLTIIESDGHRVEPITVESVHVFPGEAYVIEITANQNTARYWIRAKTQPSGAEKIQLPPQAFHTSWAILDYENSGASGDPTSEPRNCTAADKCTVLNCAFAAYREAWFPNQQCISVASLKRDAQYETPHTNSPETDVKEIFLSLKFPSSINNKRFKHAHAPFYQEPSTRGNTICGTNCDNTGCECTHVIDLPANKTIQLVLFSYVDNAPGHPIHLHGHSFEVVKVAYPLVNSTTGKPSPNPDIVCDNPSCSRQHWATGKPQGLNLNSGPLKNTVTVPAFGYTIIRFKSDNPGYWFLHCHVGNHMTEGMGVLFNESFPGIPPAPPAFPTCPDFTLNKEKFNDMLKANQKCDREGNCYNMPGEMDKKSDSVDEWTYMLVSVVAVLIALISLILNIVLIVYICKRMRKMNGSSLNSKTPEYNKGYNTHEM